MTSDVSPPLPAYRLLADQLREEIMSGRITPGSRLPTEPELCTEYGVSRSTVREALRALSSQNLIHTTRGTTGGSFVMYPDPQQIGDYLTGALGLLTASDALSVDALIEVREFLEVPAAGLAAQRATPEQVEDLLSLLDNDADSDKQVLPYRHTRDFHALVLHMSGNPLVEVVAAPVFHVLNTRFLRERAPRALWKEVDADHHVIAEHIAAGDADAARNAQHDHLTKLRKLYRGIDRLRTPS